MLKEADSVFIAHVFGHSNKLQFIYTLNNFFSISVIKLNTLNKIQIKILRFFNENFIFKRFFRCALGERCHCALMTLYDKMKFCRCAL